MKNITIKTIVLSLVCVGLVYTSDDVARRSDHGFHKTNDGRMVSVLPERFAADTPEQVKGLKSMIHQCVADLCRAYDVSPHAFPTGIDDTAEAYLNFTHDDCAVSYKIQLLGALLMYLKGRSPDSTQLYYDIMSEKRYMVDSRDLAASLGLQIAIETGFNSLRGLRFLDPDRPGFSFFIAEIMCRFQDFGCYAEVPEVADVAKFLREAHGMRNQAAIVHELRQLCTNLQKFRVLRQYLLILFCMDLTLERVVPPVVSRAASLDALYERVVIDNVKNLLKAQIAFSNRLTKRGAKPKPPIANFDLLFAEVFREAARFEGVSVVESLSSCELSRTPGDRKNLCKDLCTALHSVRYDERTGDYVLKPEEPAIPVARAFLACAFSDYREEFLTKVLPGYVEAGDRYSTKDLQGEFSKLVPEFGRTRSKRMPTAGAGGGVGVGSALESEFLPEESGPSRREQRQERRAEADLLRGKRLTEAEITRLMKK